MVAASVTWTGYGQQAYAVLRSVVADVKGGDPLRPVTVLVPTQLCGVITRRTLARGVADRPGVAGLAVLTVDRLAERLAAPMMAGSGRRPVTDPVLAAAWRSALSADPGVFAEVAGHSATVVALVDAHRQLREVGSEAHDAVAGSGEPIAVDLVRLHREVAGLLAPDWYDVPDLRRAAVQALRERPALGEEVGAVVVFLPQDLPAGATALIGHLATVGEVRTIAALTNDPRADAGVLHSIQSSSSDARPDRAVGGRTASRVAHASDADDESSCLVRMVTAALGSVPAHRVAVLYGSARPYARLLAEHLDAAGIRWNGSGVRPTIERTLPRALVDLLALPDQGWRRDEVLGVLSAAPVRTADGNRVPAARWERISRIAGVVADGDWDTRLKAYATQERAAADEEKAAEAPRQGLINRRERDASAAEHLQDFVADLRGRLHHGASLRRWSELADWALDTFQVLIGEIDAGGWLPREEAWAAERVIRILSGLAGLDPVEPTADLAGLRLAVELELAGDLQRHGRFGDGILVAPLSAAVGLDADAVFVVGLAEDLVPGRLRADPLLPDRLRALTGGALPPLRDRVARQHRHLLAALAAAGECVASFPRGDLRKSSTRLPSRWLLPTLRALSGTAALDATGWQSAAGERITGSPSYAASLASTVDLATGQEWRTRAALAASRRGDDVLDALPGEPVLGRAVTMLRARCSAGLTRFDGDLAGHDVPDPAQRTAVSPTALEAWARCPNGYFMAKMLWIEPVESPEELVRISALDIGSLIHDAVDAFFTAQSQAGTVPGGITPWTAQQRAELRHAATTIAADLAARGATGHPMLWRQELGRILSDLDRLLDDDELLRAQSGRRQVRSELVFGMRGAPVVEVALPDGRAIGLRGSADRVDVTADGAITIVDYKTGSARAFTGLSEADPTAGGTKLQLPVYAYAARAALGLPAAPVAAEYWFLRKDRGRRIQLALTPQVERAYAETLAVIADTMAAGLFPHRPPAQDGWGDFVECRFCDPDGLGVNERRDEWTRKRHDPRLAAYLRLVDPAAAATTTGAAQVVP
jgi:ATP-dependent helicase/nuclease subunit B